MQCVSRHKCCKMLLHYRSVGRVLSPLTKSRSSTDFQKNKKTWEPTQNSRPHKGDVQPVPCRGPTNIRYHRTEFRHPVFVRPLGKDIRVFIFVCVVQIGYRRGLQVSCTCRKNGGLTRAIVTWTVMKKLLKNSVLLKYWKLGHYFYCLPHCFSSWYVTCFLCDMLTHKCML